ncbi:MAG: cyclic nucleotide-binding domain-containing protein [Chloroflexi bacterium]|nr:cyclic nucleotide-binding domain-containing protein [Chloroflexota bacterium]
MGDCMYVIQEGQAEVVREAEGREISLRMLGKGDLFGEMAVVNREVRSASVRAVGDARVLTIDKKTFLRRVHEDPSLAYRILQTLSQRVRELTADLERARSGN